MSKPGCTDQMGTVSLALGLLLAGCCGSPARQPDGPDAPVDAYRIHAAWPEEWAAMEYESADPALGAGPWDEAVIERIRRSLGYTFPEAQARK